MDQEVKNLYKVKVIIGTDHLSFYAVATDPTKAVEKVRERVNEWDPYTSFQFISLTFLARSNNSDYGNLLVIS